MATWEIRGLFGNEYALELAVEALKKQSGVEWTVLDRRNLSVRLSRRNPQTEAVVRRTFEICHGWVESEAPLGKYEAKRAEEKERRAKKDEKKRKLAASQKKGPS